MKLILNGGSTPAGPAGVPPSVREVKGKDKQIYNCGYLILKMVDLIENKYYDIFSLTQNAIIINTSQKESPHYFRGQ